MLADTHGNVIVVGTRDCSLQRRNQKLVEEAPAPFLTDQQRAEIHQSGEGRSAKKPATTGAGTVEYLVGADGEISFLEVNTRLQVEHPVTEQTSGIDLVREQFRIAEGEKLRFTEDPTPRGHAFEFRINGEDPGNNFLPAPGTVTKYVEPAGPGVRIDSGIDGTSVIGGAFDSLLAKLIVTGETRIEALERSRRALDEFVVEGMATALPFHRAVVKRRRVHGRAVHHLYAVDREGLRQPDRALRSGGGRGVPTKSRPPRETVVVEVGGKRLEVSLPAGVRRRLRAVAVARKFRTQALGGQEVPAAAASGDSLTAPMQGTIVKVGVSDGDIVEAGSADRRAPRR